MIQVPGAGGTGTQSAKVQLNRLDGLDAPPIVSGEGARQYQPFPSRRKTSRVLIFRKRGLRSR